MAEKSTFGHLVGSTSRYTAGLRAWESQREDRLFYDPWAAALAGQEGANWVQQRLQTEDNGFTIIVRTRFFDDFLQRAAEEHHIRQVILLAAGLDTRAFRLPWPAQTQIFELDQPHVLHYKNETLHAAGAEPGGIRHVLEVDLRGPWQEALLQAGFDPQQPSCWLIEGLLFYLPDETIAGILREVTGLAAPQSWLGFDITNSARLTSPWAQEMNERLSKAGVPWIGSLDEPEEFLAQLGWKATAVPDTEQGDRFQRQVYPIIPPTVPQDEEFPYHWYVTATRQ